MSLTKLLEFAVISNERLDQALAYLSTTDEPTAEAKAEVERATWLCKHARAIVFEAGDGSVEARKASAETSNAVRQAEERRIEAVLAFEKLKAKRETECLVVEVWRSLNANRRVGNV